MRELRVAAVMVGLCAFGWALVAAAESRIGMPDPVVVTRLQTVTLLPDVVPWVDTPVADSLVDWERVDRDDECLWELLQRRGVPLTFEVVWAAGVWADAQGGPCAMIGEDDE